MPTEPTIISNRYPSAMLVVRKGAETGMRFALNSGTIIIGREKGVDLVLADQQSSRQHCRISSVQGQFMIEDLQSTNGTQVNGVPVTKGLALNSGDQIAIGE